MKIATKLLLGFAAVLSMALSSCSKDEPTPTTEPDAPVLPEHPTKDWQGESAHGFITDASVLLIPTSERGFVLFRESVSREYDEIVIDPNSMPDDWNFRDAPTRSGSYWNQTPVKFDGEMADPFENTEEYIALCLQHKFRWKSRFSNIDELIGLKASLYGEYICTEQINSIDIITEKYFDKNHPAGSSMKIIDHVGMYLVGGQIDYELLAYGYYAQGPGVIFGCGVDFDYPPVKWRFTLTMEGFPEQAGEYPMVIKVTMDGGKKTWEQPFTIKFVDKK